MPSIEPNFNSKIANLQSMPLEKASLNDEIKIKTATSALSNLSSLRESISNKPQNLSTKLEIVPLSQQKIDAFTHLLSKIKNWLKKNFPIFFEKEIKEEKIKNFQLIDKSLESLKQNKESRFNLKSSDLKLINEQGLSTIKINGKLLSQVKPEIFDCDKKLGNTCKKLISDESNHSESNKDIKNLNDALKANGLKAKIIEDKIDLTNYPHSPTLFAKKRFEVFNGEEKIGEILMINTYKISHSDDDDEFTISKKFLCAQQNLNLN